MAIPLYRSLLRSIRIAFEGDSARLTAARQAAREGFETNRNLAQGSEELKNSLEHVKGVATILKQNIVQGRAVSDSAESKYRKNTDGPECDRPMSPAR